MKLLGNFGRSGRIRTCCPDDSTQTATEIAEEFQGFCQSASVPACLNCPRNCPGDLGLLALMGVSFLALGCVLLLASTSVAGDVLACSAVGAGALSISLTLYRMVRS